MRFCQFWAMRLLQNIFIQKYDYNTFFSTSLNIFRQFCDTQYSDDTISAVAQSGHVTTKVCSQCTVCFHSSPDIDMASIIKDTGEIWSRLFDHRPFIQGEITFFLREFQEKRADREVERLFKILEYSTELKESQLDRTEQLGDCHLPSLKANVDVALSMCSRVLQREENFDSESVLNENRLARRKEWEKFINDMSDKCERVDQTFQEKENEIQEFYVDLEKKLHITP